MSMQSELDKNPAFPVSGLCAVPGFGAEGRASYLAQQQNRLPAFGDFAELLCFKGFIFRVLKI